MDEYDRLHALVAATSGRAVRAWARDFLTEVFEGRRDLVAIRHPLGFLCFPAWRGGGRGVCIHVWTEGVRADSTTSAMHAHSWDLLSIVLYGTVGNQILDVDDADDDTAFAPTHRLFEVHSGSEGDLVRATPRAVGYRTRSTEHFRAGQVYTLRNGAFHRSDVRGEAATVVLGTDRVGTADLSLGTFGTGDHRVRRTPCTRSETRGAARTVLTHLSERVSPNRLEDRCEWT
ncbi:hypothetical protein [Nocardia callitridis]|uniref:Cysteine dioxygenase n=1 Tax=Nocardia callitridis TaxID=648753 RepID=A0ABP9KBF7_9NOCA